MIKTVTEMKETYLKINPDISLPKVSNVEKVEDRINSILSHVQHKEISKILPFPEKESNESLIEWSDKYSKLLKQGIGREDIIKVLPEFKDPNNIPNIVEKLYGQNPKKAGEFAEKYIGFNPFIDFYTIFSRSISEPYEDYIIPQTQDTVKFRYDLLSIDGLYEFKLTTQNNLKKRLKEALVQLYLYDFLFRMKYGIRHYFPIIIDIYLVDKREIITFRTGYNNFKMQKLEGKFEEISKLIEDNKYNEIDKIYAEIEDIKKEEDYQNIDIDKDALKEIFKINSFNNLDKLNIVIDDIYRDLDPCLEEDIDKLLRKFRYR